MAGWKRRILGIMVISGGVCAALPFRNDTANSPVDPREAAVISGSKAPRDDLTLQLMIPIGPNSVPTTAREPEGTSAVLEPTPPLQPQELRRDDLQTPPRLASSFETFAGAVPFAQEATVPSTKRDQPERRHRIADGDTLEAIAEEYLGSRTEWQSIFAHNEGILTDPDILPIGKEIRIPTTTAPSHNDDCLVPIPIGLLNRD